MMVKSINNLLQKQNPFFLEIDVIAFKQFPLIGTSFKFYIWQLSAIIRLYVIFFKGIPLIPPINDNVTERLRITLFTGFAIYETRTNMTIISSYDIPWLYLEPRFHKQFLKQKINNHGTCLAKPLHTKQQKRFGRQQDRLV